MGSKARKSLELNKKQNEETLLHWCVQDSHLECIVQKDGMQQDNNEGSCALWWPCALVPAIVPLRGLEKEIMRSFQRYVILHAEQWTGLS